MTEREKLALLEDIMELDEGDLSVDMALEDIEEYNSMTKLSLIVRMEDEFDVKLDGDTIKATFDDGTQTEFFIERENGLIKNIRLGYNDYTVYLGQGEKITEEKNISEN